MLLEYDDAASLRNGKKREIAPPRHASLRQIAREGRKHTRRCAKSPAERQNASQSLRPQAQMEFKSFLPATCASAKILLGSQTCARRACAAASRDPLKWESPAGLSHLNIKKAHPKVRPLRNAVGVRLEPARLGRWVAARSLPRFQRPAKAGRPAIHGRR